MSRKYLSAAVALACTIMAGDAQAMNLNGSARIMKNVQNAFITEQEPTLAPMGHVVFCMQYKAECRTSTMHRVGRVQLKDDRLAVLQTVNREVNRAIRPQSDARVQAISDQWSLAPAAGDCEDYAITKRHALIARGFPASALRLATARTRSGEGHAVLIVRTHSGDLVLDNRTNAILPWTSTGLHWVSIQSGTNPHYWNRI